MSNIRKMQLVLLGASLMLAVLRILGVGNGHAALEARAIDLVLVLGMSGAFLLELTRSWDAGSPGAPLPTSSAPRPAATDSSDCAAGFVAAQNGSVRQDAWATFVEPAFDGVLLLGVDGNIRQLNAAAEQMFGQFRHGIIGRSLVNLLVAEDSRGEVSNALKACLEAPTDIMSTQRLSFSAVNAFGAGFVAEAVIARDSAGDSPQLVVHIRDIAQQARINDLEITLSSKTLELAHNSLELKFAEARRSTILEAAIDGIISFDHERRVVEFNPAAERAFGLRKADVLGNDLIETIIPPAGLDAQRRILSDWLERYHQEVNGEMIELTVARRDGSTFSVEVAMARVQVGHVVIYTVYLRDITERKRIERMKSEFIAVVSHELRSPLTSILGSLGLIEGGVFGHLPGRALDLVRIARSNTDRLIRLVNDILDLEKIEAGKFAVQISLVDPREVMAAACQGLRGSADAAGVELRSQNLYPGWIEGDRDRLIQVLTNLISNAVKFSPPQGRIDILCVAAGESGVRFSVTDQGPGISADQIPLLFSKFQQLDASDSRSRGGTGLGLAISKAIVELHGGRMIVESASGHGSTFSFELPAEASARDTDFESAPDLQNHLTM